MPGQGCLPGGPRPLAHVPQHLLRRPAVTHHRHHPPTAAARALTGNNGRVLDYNGLDQLVAVSIPGPSGAQQVLHSYGYDGLRTVTEGVGVPRLWFTPNLVHQGTGRQWYLKDGSRTIVRLDLAPLPQPAASRFEGADSSSRILAGLGRAVGGAIANLSLLAGLIVAAVAVRSRARPRAALGTGVLVAAVLVSSCRTAVQSTPAVSARPSALWEVAEATYFHGGLSAGPQLLTRQDGSVFEERRYEPFGAPIDAYSQPVNGGPAVVGGVNFSAEPLNVLNKETEPVSGFSYHGARWMAPQTATWLTPDPPVKAPDPKFLWEPWDLHPYQYVAQNPVIYWDPDGMDKESWAMTVAGFGAGFAQGVVPFAALWGAPTGDLVQDPNFETGRGWGLISAGVVELAVGLTMITAGATGQGGALAVAGPGGLIALPVTGTVAVAGVGVGAHGGLNIFVGDRVLTHAKDLAARSVGSAAGKGGNVTKEVIERGKPGRDGATSKHIVEKMDGETISKTHQVTKDGKVMHQHQDHVGKHGGERRFPDEWTGTETINAPNHIPRVGP